MLGEKVLLKLRLRIVIQTEHCEVERQHVLIRNLIRARRWGVAHDDFHIIRQIGRPRRVVSTGDLECERQGDHREERVFCSTHHDLI